MSGDSPSGGDPTGKLEVGAQLDRQRHEKTNENFTGTRRTRVRLGRILEHEAQATRDGTRVRTRTSRVKVTLVVVLVGALAALIGFFGYRAISSGPDGAGNGAVTTTAPSPSALRSSTSAAATTTSVTTTSTTLRTSAPATPIAPAAGPIAYKLTAVQSVVWNNGFDSVTSVRIGSMPPFPDSIVGNYQSSAADQNNKAIWVTGGQCSVFDVWIGKDAGSGNSGSGAGRFVVMDNAREVDSRSMGPDDPPYHWQVDITGVVRLTIYDTRASKDMANAWGTPQVTCTGPPG